jgi:hypothetical protein
MPRDATVVNSRVWFQDLHGVRAVFVEQTPFYSYPIYDQTQRYFCALQLVEAELALVKEVCPAFEIHPRNFPRLRNKFRQGGIEALVPKSPGRKSIRKDIAQSVLQLYQQGDNVYQIADKLGRSPSTIERTLRDQDVTLRSAVKSPQLFPEQSETSNDETPNDETPNDEVSTVEATSIPYASPLDRFATVLGLIEEAPVEFQSAENVPQAGVLLGLALLEETHLLEEARAVYGKLNNGWYGLRSLLWTLVVMALLRIKRPEQLKHHDPAELGRVLGLPRAAEVKTIRRKLSEISARGQAAELHRRLARRRAEESPATLATLYVDGHVRAYHGKHRIGQTRVSRLKRVMRAEMDYWVHLADGEPLLVVHETVDSSFREALRDHVLPEIRRVVGERRVRIVFDREGWSRELFEDLLRLNFDFMTYRKGPYKPLPESDFKEATFTVAGQPAVHYALAETTFEEEGWPRLRLVAKKKTDGGQTHVLATGQLTWASRGEEVGAADLPAAEMAWWMFHRWSQENWFKYMRAEYALDVLVDYSVELEDGDLPVVNPRWRELDRQVASVRSRLERAQAKYACLVLKAEEKVLEEKSKAESSSSICESADCECLRCRGRAQSEEVSQLTGEYNALRSERRATPRKIPLSEASDRDGVKLSYERKLFTDTIKLCAYEIETRLYELLGGTFCNRATEGRGLIQELLSTSGDLRVASDVIEVHLEQLSAPRYTAALQSLCEKLNTLSPRLTETSHDLRFVVKPRPTGSE